jgi:hypothetical protein
MIDPLGGDMLLGVLTVTGGLVVTVVTVVAEEVEFPPGDVAEAVMEWVPSATADDDLNTQKPVVASATTVPSVVEPSFTVTVIPGLAVPIIVGVLELKLNPKGVISIGTGGDPVVSIKI